MTLGRRKRLLQMFLMLLVVSVAISACGGGGDTGSDSSAGGVSEGDLAKYEDRLDELYEGTYEKPTAGAPKSSPGKSIWFIPVSLNIEPAVQAKEGLEEGAEKLGWDLTVFDGKFESSKQLTGVEQAIAAGADAIVLFNVECAQVKSGLEQAKAAGIATIAIESTDCDPALFAHEVRYAGNRSYIEWSKGWGEANAAWVIAKTKGEAKTVIAGETDLASTRVAQKGWEAEFAKCPTCEIVANAAFVGAEFGPQLQQKIEQVMLQNPDANSFIPAYDAVMTSGGATALQASGRLGELTVAGGEGSRQGIEQIYAGNGMQSFTGIYAGQEAFGALDALVRIFGNAPIGESNTGIGWQVGDKEHNLPPKGDPYQPPYDYQSIYYGYWGVK